MAHTYQERRRRQAVRACVPARVARCGEGTLHAAPSSLSPNRSTLTLLLPFLLPRPPAQARRRLRLWRRTWFRMRNAVLFWLKITVEHTCAEGGVARKRDREDFEADNAM